MNKRGGKLKGEEEGGGGNKRGERDREGEGNGGIIERYNKQET